MSNSNITIDHAARCHTALFVLLGGLRRSKGSGIDYPVNRPGQNAAECYTLAALAFILVAGFFTVLIGGFLGSHLWSFALALPLGSLLAFAAFHIQFFGFAYIYRRLRGLRLVPSSAPQKLPVTVYLGFFTLSALAMVFSGKPVLIAIATPWVTWFMINLFAGVVLFVGKTGSQRNGNSE